MGDALGVWGMLLYEGFVLKSTDRDRNGTECPQEQN